MGVFDSSFLFMPLGNDLLVIAMTLRTPNHWKMPFYAGMAALGSVLGCWITDAIGRKGGEASLEKYLPKRRLDFVKKKVKERAGWALALASIMPPPFPFTPFVIAAAAMGYARKKLLTVIGLVRLARFLTEGLLAIWFGHRLIELAETPLFRWCVIGIILLCVCGSAVSIYAWIRRSRTA